MGGRNHQRNTSVIHTRGTQEPSDWKGHGLPNILTEKGLTTVKNFETSREKILKAFTQREESHLQKSEQNIRGFQLSEEI